MGNLAFGGAVKGDVICRVNGWVYIRQFYTGVRFKAPESAVWIYHGECGTIARADEGAAVAA